MGLGRTAVRRLLDERPPRNDVEHDLAELRASGFHREAAIAELVTTSEDAAALARTVTARWWNENRLWHTVVMVAVTASSIIDPVVPLLVVVALSAAAVRWVVRRRQAIGEPSWDLLVDWWLEPIRTSAPHRWLLLIAVLFIGGAFYAGLVESRWVQVAVTGTIAVGLILLVRRALRPARPGLPDPDGDPAGRAGRPSASPQPTRPGSPGPHPISAVRPRMPWSAMAPGYAAFFALLVVMLGVANGTALAWAAAPGAGAALLGLRAFKSRLDVDGDGVTDVGLIRTRRWRWDQIRAVVAKEDGEARARAQLLVVGSRPITIWSGSIDDPNLIQIMSFGEAHAAGGDSERRSLRGCLTAALWVMVAVAVVAIAGLRQSPALVPVALISVPAGVEVERDAHDTGDMRGGPYVTCAPPLSEPTGWEPPGCADERSGQEAMMGVMAAVAVAAGIGLVLSYRRARRAARPTSEGPIVS